MPVATRKPDSSRKKHVTTLYRTPHGVTLKVRHSPGKVSAFKKMIFPRIFAGKFDVVTFCKKYGMKRELVSRMTSYAPRTVAAWAAGKPIKGAAIQKVTELQRLTGALEELVETEAIGPWFQTPNPAFDGSTPAQLVERGESDRLWRMIHILESGQPG